MDHSLVPLLAVLGLGVFIALVFQRLGASALVAYLLTGALAAPGVLGLVDSSLIRPIAEIGATLLLFSIGLELDLAQMRRQARAIAIAAPTQIVLTTLVGAGCAWLAGLPLGPAIALGACLTMTSTIMMLRSLDEHRLLGRNESSLALGVTLVQDVMIGPLLVLFSFLFPVEHHASPWLMVSGIVATVVAVVALRRVLASRLLARIRSAQLPELETAFAVTVALGAAALTEQCGLGAAFGAFAAGLAFGGRERNAVEGGMRPIFGLTAVFFFVSMGLLFDVKFVIEQFWTVLALLIAGTVLKAAIAGFALRAAGMEVRSALGYGLVLANIGEFAFVLAAGAFANQTDPEVQKLYRLMVATTCISLALTPLLVRCARPLLPEDPLRRISASGDTVVVAGLGPMGNLVVETLRRRGHPLFLIDRNEKLLATWQGVGGIRTHVGRIEQLEDWLPLIGHHPSLVILTFPIADASAVVASRLRTLAPDLPILARSPFLSQVSTLRQAGVRWIICDEEETARAFVPMLEDALAAAGARQDQGRVSRVTLQGLQPSGRSEESRPDESAKSG